MPEFHDNSAVNGTKLAVLAEVLYLVNLLLLPGIAFICLLLIWYFRVKQSAPLAIAHLQQTVSASLWAGVILVIVNLLILLLGGYEGAWTWVILILYFTICHSVLVLLGAFGLAKAMSGQCWRYPLVGRPLPEGC